MALSHTKSSGLTDKVAFCCNVDQHAHRHLCAVAGAIPIAGGELCQNQHEPKAEGRERAGARARTGAAAARADSAHAVAVNAEPAHGVGAPVAAGAHALRHGDRLHRERRHALP